MEHPAHTLATLKVASTSKPLTFQVKRQAQEHFVAPTVLEAANNGNGPLDPSKATSGATVRVKYDPMQTSDTLVVTWSGVNQADSWKSKSENGSTSGHVDFTVPVSVVAASQGKTIEVAYAVVRNGQPNPSVPLKLLVSTLAQQELPTPEVPQAKDGVLDLTAFSGAATVKVLKSTGSVWPLWAEKQTYWIVLEGTQTDGKEYTYYLANKEVLSEAQGRAGLNIELPRTQLERLKHNSTLTVTLKVGYDPSGIENDARVFPVADYTVSSVVKLCEDFTSAPIGSKFPDDVWTKIPSGTSIMPSPGSAPPYPDAQIVDYGGSSALRYVQSYFAKGVLKSSAHMQITMVKSPLKRALKVTTVLNFVTDSGPDRKKTLNIGYSLDGNREAASASLVEGHNEIALILPIGASYWGIGFLIETTDRPEGWIDTSSTIHILSICCEEQ
ncbi:hypothetical protein [Pseudomonas xantholysinigenes]|uniref:Uncharacterized protein n=1 Tax=Pseudomonas xantholysinigenes TaxID=2745490 RepID=A0A9E6PUV0_9PSED|nr:hypothetical protein [Pseudomonas xantholysinigenes]QXI36896.1 hypothetical protein HU772_016250 [Pseudomonas xantholysinigenes]